MKLALLTYFAASMACTTAANADAVKVMPELFGAEQLVDVDAHCEGCQPDYCYADKGEPADYACYKSGYPKCCTKDKGNCPNNNKPGCECDGPCTNNTPDRDQKCWLRGVNGDSTCPSGQYCEVAVGDCMLRIADVEGRCKPKPDACTSQYDPVCGCDNDKTYSNACAAASAGENVAWVGECHEPYSCVRAQGQDFPLCQENDNNQNAYCDGTNDCGSTFCDCQAGNNFCDSGVNPCEDEEPYTCVGVQGQEFPLCAANGNDAGAYCDGEGDCNTSLCACDAGEDFCNTRNNPCD